MTFPDSNSLKVTIADLKEIVVRLQGNNSESTKLLSQIEALVSEIETKTDFRESSSMTVQQSTMQISI